VHWESPEALKSLMTTFATAVQEQDEVLKQLSNYALLTTSITDN